MGCCPFLFTDPLRLFQHSNPSSIRGKGLTVTVRPQAGFEPLATGSPARHCPGLSCQICLLLPHPSVTSYFPGFRPPPPLLLGGGAPSPPSTPHPPPVPPPPPHASSPPLPPRRRPLLLLVLGAQIRDTWSNSSRPAAWASLRAGPYLGVHHIISFQRIRRETRPRPTTESKNTADSH